MSLPGDPKRNLPAHSDETRTCEEFRAAVSVSEETGLPAGTRIDHFEIVECVGSGGMGVVYRARDVVLDRVVALKLLRIDDPRMGLRMMNEARAQARIEHENICKVYEVGESEFGRYIAMQYIAGQTLAVAAREMGLTANL